MTGHITQTVYLIRAGFTGRLIDSYEGEDGKQRALDLVYIHNQIYPGDPWIVVERKL